MAGLSVNIGCLRSKRVAGMVACLIALAIVYFGFGMGGQSPKSSADASTASNPPAGKGKPVQAMNLALGNMVVLAQELGFSVKSAQDAPVDGSKIARRIENHLQQLREIYRQESAANGALVGNVLLQFKISGAGEVSQVSELSARINDAPFKSAILAEVAKWSFVDIAPEPLTVTCPLLFVREGMDITTLVQWEKSFANASANSQPVRHAESPAPVAAAKTARATTPPAMAAKIAPRPVNEEFSVKYSTSLRKKPDFSSASLTTIAAGTRVTLLSKSGDWLEVRLNAAEPSGFIRKEFVKPVEVAGD